MSGLSERDREALADAVDAAYDFGETWVRFIRNGNEDMLLPVVAAIRDEAKAEALAPIRAVANSLLQNLAATPSDDPVGAGMQEAYRHVFIELRAALNMAHQIGGDQ